MTDVDIWMPVFVGDFLKKTGHLSAEEVGAYQRLQLHYWSHGSPLPDDDKRLARITGQSVEEWLGIREIIAGFFNIHGCSWHDHNLEVERKKAASNKSKRIDSAKKAGIASGKARQLQATGGLKIERVVEPEDERVVEPEDERVVELQVNPSPSPSPSPS
ncbi:MAG: YdaU family protein, partial [Gammaproteobacteria bacterium]|nr:YdaU family protein [Gammaproteobacteria bacterium]